MAAIDEGKQGSESGGEKGEGPADSGGEVAIAVSGKKVEMEGIAWATEAIEGGKRSGR